MKLKNITLIKISDPGWEKEFSTYEDVRIELLKHICNNCINEMGGYVSEGRVFEEIKPSINLVEDLLATSCGLEYYIVDNEDDE